jgi:uncharacterized protein YbjQ (UPF0145 family)
MASTERPYLPMYTLGESGVYCIEGKPRMCEPLGLVFVHKTQGMGWIRDIAARLRDFFGGGVRSYDKPVQRDLILPGLRELSDMAYDYYDNPMAILGVTFEVMSIGSKGMAMMSITIKGTAVRWVEVEGLPVIALKPLPVSIEEPVAA